MSFNSINLAFSSTSTSASAITPTSFRPKRNIPLPPGPPAYPAPTEPERMLKKRAFEVMNDSPTESTDSVTELFSSHIQINQAELEEFIHTAEEHYHVNDNDNAELFTNKAADINPNAYDVLILKAKLHRRKNELAEAEKFFLKAIENEPTQYVAYTSYAYLQLDMGHERTAIRMGMESLAICPNQPLLLEILRNLPNFEKEVTSKKKQIRIHTNANQIHEIDDRFTSLKLEIEEVESRIASGKDLHSMIQLGMLYYKNGEYPKAIETLEEVLTEATEPSEDDGKRDVSVPYILGKSYLKLNQFPQAEQYLLLALSLTNKPKKIYKPLIALYLKSNELESATFYQNLL